MEGGWKTPSPPLPQCYNETKKPSAYRVKEQGITIVSILTAVGMAIGVLVEALLGGPSVTASGSISGGDGKGSGARE